MTRKKVKLQFIDNDSMRKATFKKRKKGLIKKINELSTLCDVDACAVIYSPFDPQPEIWPSPWRVQNVLNKFRKMPDLEQSKRMMNQESFIAQRISKTNEQLRKLRKDNREKLMTQLMYQYLNVGKIQHNMTMSDLNDLSLFIDQNMMKITKRIDELVKPTLSQIQPNVAGQNPTPTFEIATGEAQGAGTNIEWLLAKERPGLEANMGGLQNRQWFMGLDNNGREGMLPIGDANYQNPFWFNTFFP
ncbi:hypothetical protein L6164_001136 [Bauhinia variegata]|uniref:Uncharacterized protein n=1 Tax=Bauhinia variegata TaxID=167791 RepID=A0ACB9QF47_BAUVA|nr:hypothetical protein L6164_001136 [Bauhinia variegata]